MRRMTVREMRAALGRLDELLHEEGEVVITRHGKPVARVVALPGAHAVPSHRELREAMPRLEPSSAELVREDRDERG
jgi:antitoxin (DNA-binding transcriptional repressor) of toxin-antitoxin stability system